MDIFRQQVNSLLTLIANGNEMAVEELYKLAGGRMLSVAFSVTRNRQLAEEAVSESFIKIVKKCDSFLRGSNGYGWICKITQNTALNILKRERKRKDVPIEDIYSLASLEGQDNDEKLGLKLALSKLDEEERYLIFCRYYQDMGVREIAATLKSSKSTVDRKLRLAEERLKTLLSE